MSKQSKKKSMDNQGSTLLPTPSTPALVRPRNGIVLAATALALATGGCGDSQVDPDPGPEAFDAGIGAWDEGVLDAGVVALDEGVFDAGILAPDMGAPSDEPPPDAGE